MQYDYQNNQRLEFDVRIGDRRLIPAVDLRLQTHTVTADVNLDSNLDRKINFGIMGRFQDNFANPDTGVRRLIPDYDKYDLGAYIIGDYQANEEWLFEIGARFDFTKMDVFKFYRTSFWESRNYNQLGNVFFPMQSDGWFMGMVPNLVTGVWVGGEDRAVHFDDIAFGQGATMALPIWGQFMKKAYLNPELGISKEDFPVPEIVSIPLDCENLNIESSEKKKDLEEHI